MPLWTIWTEGTATGMTQQVTWSNWTATSTNCTAYIDPWPYWQETSSVVHNAPPASNRLRRNLEAGKRARALLREHLDEQQRREYREKLCFHLHVGDRVYRVKQGKAGNVELIEQDRPIRRYCIHPANNDIPAEDVMLAQKLLLETDEQEFLRVANESFA